MTIAHSDTGRPPASDASHSDRGVARPYYYLWHLAALKVIDADFGEAPRIATEPDQSSLSRTPTPVIRGTVWDEIEARATVAAAQASVMLIDVGVSRLHPNLNGDLETTGGVDPHASIDFASHPYGARVLPGDGGEATGRERREAFFEGLDLSDLGDVPLHGTERDLLEAIAQELIDSRGVVRRLSIGEETLASHGTACAGLIMGHPVPVSRRTPGPSDFVPYYGVDPFARLISVRTSFEADPLQFIAAFLYALKVRPDVIVLPRGIPDPQRSALPTKESLKADLETWANRTLAEGFARRSEAGEGLANVEPTAVELRYAPHRLWNIVEALMVAVSRQIPIACAAGNDGESQLIYPASLAAKDNGIIAVGAVSAEGFRSGYSNYGEGLTVVAPSDDGEVLTRHQLRLDVNHPFHEDYDFGEDAPPSYAYAPLELVTTDLPGLFGYEGSSAGRLRSALPEAELAGVCGHYTTFGGTSGAAALVGGVLSLIQRASRAVGAESLDGVSAKTILCQTAEQETAVAPGTRRLSPDPMNVHDELAGAHGLTTYFGAGLIDAAAAVDAVLSAYENSGASAHAAEAQAKTG